MFSERIQGVKSSAIRDILKVISRPGMISFAGGLPAPELFPVRRIAESAQNVLLQNGPAALQYTVTEGIAPLREKILARLGPAGSRLTMDNIIITQGSQQGLDLISKIFLDKGTVVLTENPSYLGALQSFQLFQATVIAVPSDGEGLIVKALEEKLDAHKPRLMYIMPTYRNPTGGSISLKRRSELANALAGRDMLVLEDDPYGELVFEGERMPSLFSLAKSGNFIYMSSFSKTVAPGFRVAYIAAANEIVRKLAVAKQGTDLQTNTLGQYILNDYLENGNYDEHVSLIRATYRERRDVMLAAMERYFPKTLSWNRPAGGMFLWATLPEGADAAALLERCVEQQVAFVPGKEFFPDGSGANTLRLNFSNADPANIEEGIKRMAAVFRDALK